MEKSQLSRGSFYVDLAQKRLLLWDRANLDLRKGRNRMEAATRSAIWTMAGSYLQTRGITFRYAANTAQHGAVSIKGGHCLLEDCTVERSNGAGLSITGEDAIVRRCRMQDNGQLGFGAGHADRLLMTACEVRNNNTKDFSRGWEAGGDKVCMSRDVVLEKSIFADNRGSGIWFDIGNEKPTVRNCLIANNEDGGIFYEISYGLHAHDNVILGNGFDAGAGSWGGNGAIAMSSSPGCTIERNLMLGNRKGFRFASSSGPLPASATLVRPPKSPSGTTRRRFATTSWRITTNGRSAAGSTCRITATCRWPSSRNGRPRMPPGRQRNRPASIARASLPVSRWNRCRSSSRIMSTLTIPVQDWSSGALPGTAATGSTRPWAPGRRN